MSVPRKLPFFPHASRQHDVGTSPAASSLSLLSTGKLSLWRQMSSGSLLGSFFSTKRRRNRRRIHHNVRHLSRRYSRRQPALWIARQLSALLLFVMSPTMAGDEGCVSFGEPQVVSDVSRPERFHHSLETLLRGNRKRQSLAKLQGAHGHHALQEV